MKRSIFSLCILLASAMLANAQFGGPAVAVRTVISLPATCQANNQYTHIIELRSGVPANDGLYRCKNDGTGWTGPFASSSPPGGSNTQVQYNNAGALGGISGLTTNGSTTLTQTSNSATAFSSGPNGATNPVLLLNNSTASQKDGISITGGATTTGTTIQAISDGTTSPLILAPKGDGGNLIISRTGAGSRFLIDTNGGHEFSFDFSTFRGGANALFSWSDTADSALAALDTTLSRQGAGVVQVGTSAANASGSLKFTNAIMSGKTTTYNNETTAGAGTGYIRGFTSQKAETIAPDANVLTVTPAATVGTYRISVVIMLSAANTATIGWTATWKDSAGNAQAPTNMSLRQTGVAAPALTFTTSAAGNYYGEAIIDIDNSATNIVIKYTGAGTSTTAKVSAFVERIN